MSASANNLEQRLAELKGEVTARGFDRHASVFKEISELHPELQSPAVTARAASGGIEQIVAFPAQIQRGWHYVPKQALLLSGAMMTHLLASVLPGEGPQVTGLQGSDLMYLRVKLLLLYGFLEIVAKGKGTPVRIALEFNTVNWHCLWPPLQRFLETTREPLAGSQGGCSRLAQQTVKTLPIKFFNGLQLYGLLPGEQLEEVVFQAETWKPRLYFFREPALANTLLILSTRYMVVIQEELDVKQGWIVSYMPRSSILRIKNRRGDLWNEFSVQLKRGDQSVDYPLKLNRETAEAWRKLWVQHAGVWEECL